MPTAIEVQLLSQADIDAGVDITFVKNDSNTSVHSTVPHPAIGMQNFLNYIHSYLTNFTIYVLSLL